MALSCSGSKLMHLTNLAKRIGLGASALIAVLLVGGHAATAAPTASLSGGTGLIKIPTALVLPEGAFDLGFSWIGGPQSYLFRPKGNRSYFISLGLLSGLEVSLDMLQVIGWVDPEASGVSNAIHRLSNAKYQLPLPEGLPRVAFGVQDPFSVNGLTRGQIGQTNYGLTTYYGAVSHSVGPVSFHLGYGQSESFIRGAYGGVDWTLGCGLNVRTEYDSQRWNLGVLWQPVPWISLTAARLFPDDWGYGMGLRWRL